MGSKDATWEDGLKQLVDCRKEYKPTDPEVPKHVRKLWMTYLTVFLAAVQGW